jgi:hypothetical protein
MRVTTWSHHLHKATWVMVTACAGQGHAAAGTLSLRQHPARAPAHAGRRHQPLLGCQGPLTSPSHARKRWVASCM